MKRMLKACLFVLLLASAQTSMAQNPSPQTHKITYGPYLQNLTSDGVIVSFATNYASMSHIEVREKGSTQVSHYETLKDGLRMTHITQNNICVDGLQPNTEYEYRVVSRKTEKYDPYDIRFGEPIHSDWYSFRTFDPTSEEFTFVATSDIHDDAAKCQTLLRNQPLDEAEAVFFVGDIICDISRIGQAYTGVIEPATKLFAKNKPLVLARGNHEVRGYHCRELDDYFARTDGKYYSLQRYGKTAVLILDSGEDKADASKVFNGVKALEQYIDEEIEWLREVVKSKEWRKAAHRIVMIHIPPASQPMRDIEALNKILCWGSKRWGEKALDIFNRADVDLMISGHTHKYFFVPERKGEQNYPLIINDNRSAMSVKIDQEGIAVKVTNLDGEVLLDEQFKD